MSLRSAFRCVVVFDDLVADFFDVPYNKPIMYTKFHNNIVEYGRTHGTDGLFMRRILDMNRTMKVTPEELPRYAWKYLEEVPDMAPATATAAATATATAAEHK